MTPVTARTTLDAANPGPNTKAAPKDTIRPDDQLRCAACDHPVTALDTAIELNGAHAHHFVNPHGHAFHVALFKHAPGVTLAGPPVDFYSWFPGLPWQLALCSNCRAHLGWSFGAPVDFYALVRDRLVQ